MVTTVPTGPEGGAMLLIVADMTVSVVLPLMLPEVAVMVLVPLATPVPRPVASTVATLVVPLLQVTFPDALALLSTQTSPKGTQH